MSQENVEIVRSIFAQWERGDFASADWMDPDIEFVGADGGVSHGVAAVNETWADFLSAWDHFVTTAEEVLDAGDDQVLVFVRFEGRGRTSGAPLTDFSGANLFTLKDGRVRRLVLYPDRKEALEVAGLPARP